MPLLLTGFPPFAPALDTFVLGNSSQKMVNHFSGPPPSFWGGSKEEFEEIKRKVRTSILPVKAGSANLPGTSAKSLHDLLANEDPESVVCLGHHFPYMMSSSAHLELVAYKPRDLQTEEGEKRSWFADRIADDARTFGMATTLGPEFLARGPCNDTYWTAIEWAGTGKAVAFLHLPPYMPVERRREEQIFRQVLFVLMRALNLHSPPRP